MVASDKKLSKLYILCVVMPVRQREGISFGDSATEMRVWLWNPSAAMEERWGDTGCARLLKSFPVGHVAMGTVPCVIRHDALCKQIQIIFLSIYSCTNIELSSERIKNLCCLFSVPQSRRVGSKQSHLPVSTIIPRLHLETGHLIVFLKPDLSTSNGVAP